MPAFKVPLDLPVLPALPDRKALLGLLALPDQPVLPDQRVL